VILLFWRAIGRHERDPVTSIFVAFSMRDTHAELIRKIVCTSRVCVNQDDFTALLVAAQLLKEIGRVECHYMQMGCLKGKLARFLGVAKTIP
jgi:hypothetical protein